jgi:hypothetical protein
MSKKAKKKVAKRHLKSIKKTKGKPAKKAAKASRPAASTAVRDHAVNLLKFARATMNKYLGAIPEDKITAQPNGLANHALWTYGHLATTCSWGLSVIAGPGAAVPEGYEKLFGMDSTPTADASQYPPLAEVKKYYDELHERLVIALHGMTDADLEAPIEAMGFAKTKGDLATKLAWHEGWHLGQVADLRRVLGITAKL